MRIRMELDVLQKPAASSNTAKKRHRSAKRLLRASQHAQKLAFILQQLYFEYRGNNMGSTRQVSAVTASTLLQAEIYALYMAGTHLFSLASSSSSNSQSTAKKGATALSTAYVLLEAFAKHAERATDEALAFEMLDELEPMIRFCAYKAGYRSSQASVMETARMIGTPSASSSEDPTRYADIVQNYEIEERFAKARKGSKTDKSEAPKSIQWRDINVPVRSAELSSALGKVQSALNGLEDGDENRPRKRSKDVTVTSLAGDYSARKATGADKAMAIYDKPLAILGDAEERARKLAEDNAMALSKAHSARFESAAKPLSIAHSYIKFQLLSLRIQRDESLFSSTVTKLQQREIIKAQTGKCVIPSGPTSARMNQLRAKTYPILVKLLDSILQSLDQLRELDVVEEDSADLAGKVDAKIAFDKARRYTRNNHATFTHIS